MDSPEDHGSLDFDPDFAATTVGKYILVGVTVEERRGEFRRNEQFHGTVLATDARAGITLRLGGSRDSSVNATLKRNFRVCLGCQGLRCR
jgi:hypothetical protein